MYGLKQPFSGARRRERDWFSGDAADAAIKKLWTAADNKIDHVEGRLLKMLLSRQRSRYRQQTL